MRRLFMLRRGSEGLLRLRQVHITGVCNDSAMRRAHGEHLDFCANERTPAQGGRAA
jgi:hypothetical protein